VAGGKARDGAALEAELARAATFRTQLRRFLSVTDAAVAQVGLTSQRYDLLLMIRSAGGLRVTDLRELLQLKQSSVSELVTRSVEAGLIERRVSSKDRRVSLLQLTPEGERRLLLAFTVLRDDRDALAAVFRGVDRRFRAFNA
jgi:DNA-binding MarR family transcriptional regulator